MWREYHVGMEPKNVSFAQDNPYTWSQMNSFQMI